MVATFNVLYLLDANQISDVLRVNFMLLIMSIQNVYSCKLMGLLSEGKKIKIIQIFQVGILFCFASFFIFLNMRSNKKCQIFHVKDKNDDKWPPACNAEGVMESMAAAALSKAPPNLSCSLRHDAVKPSPICSPHHRSLDVRRGRRRTAWRRASFSTPSTPSAAEAQAPGLYSAKVYELTKENVDLVLDDVRPYLIADGGNVDVVSVDDGVISLQLQGRTSFPIDPLYTSIQLLPSLP